jgi:hypothetical protein
MRKHRAQTHAEYARWNIINAHCSCYVLSVRESVEKRIEYRVGSMRGI